MQATKLKLLPKEQINKLLINFDFVRVHDVMKALDWKYWDSDEVPNISQLVLIAQGLLEDACRGLVSSGKDEYFVATGGFEATAYQYPDGEMLLELKFVATSFNYSNLDTCY